MGDAHAKDACDKKVARSELRVIVILQCALHKPLDRALLGLRTRARRTRRWLLRLGLVFVILRLPVVSGMAVLPALLRVSMRDPMGASGDDLLGLVLVVRFFFVSAPRSDQAVAA